MEEEKYIELKEDYKKLCEVKKKEEGKRLIREVGEARTEGRV